MSGRSGVASRMRRTRPAPPVRIIHLGLGAFSRAHLAWYTDHAPDAAEWGIAAYTGRSTALAATLSAQDSVFTLIERGAQGDHDEVIESIVRAHPGTEVSQLVKDIAAPGTAIVSLTITEAAYGTQGDSSVDDAQFSADRRLFSGLAARELADVHPQTMLGRLVLGLEARRRAGAGPLALMSCDNLPDNGGVLRRAVLELASEAPETSQWCREHVSFVSSSVDRITPRLAETERVQLSEEYGDEVPVVTEPFSDWVLSGDFPAGRPRWEDVGARITTALDPWEARKLWLLNGAHTLLACMGRLQGCRTVAEAIAHPLCRRAVEAYWEDAAQHLPAGLDLDAYRRDLIARFSNPRIEHLLSQIAINTTTKLRLRIAPVAEATLRDQGSSAACAEVFGAWLAIRRREEDVTTDVASALKEISPPLAAHSSFREQVGAARSRLESGAF